MNDSVRRTPRDPDATIEARFDTRGLELQEDVQGFDPYAHARLPPGPRVVRQRTDLRALSAQILAERERNRKPE